MIRIPNISRFLSWRWALLAVFAGGLVLAGVFAFRAATFDTEGVVLEVRAPERMDVSSEGEIVVTVNNSTRAELRWGEALLEFPESIEVLGENQEVFTSLKSRQARSMRFRIRASGAPGEKADIGVRLRFRTGRLSATFEKEASATIEFLDLPFDLSFSFPSDARADRPVTFFLRVASRADTQRSPVGVALVPPPSFQISRTLPRHSTMTPEGLSLWDMGDFPPKGEEEIAVTGTFQQELGDAEFRARVGILNEERSAFIASREVRGTLSLRPAVVPVDIVYRDTVNPPGALVKPGERIPLTLRFTNETERTLEELSLFLALAHPSLDEREATASQLFSRDVTGEFAWTHENLAALQRLAPNQQHEITFSIPLIAPIPIDSFDDANQTITARARVVSGGQILGERTLEIKISGVLSVNAEVFRSSTLDTNFGPIPPRVGEETSYTVVLTVSGGTNAVHNTAARIILGRSVRYDTLIEPSNAEIFYDEGSREVRWLIGGVPAGLGTFLPPKQLVFRIVLTPQDADLDTIPELVSAVQVTGEDAFTGQTIEGSDGAIDADLPDDFSISRRGGSVVEP